MHIEEIRHFHVYAGAGGGAIGFNKGRANIGTMIAKPRCIGGIDVMPEAMKNFEAKTGATGTVIDLFDRQQYIDWHGKEPPLDWSEATPSDIRRAANNESPNIIFTSPPCKGFSGLLNQKMANTTRYQALNRLTVRGIALCMEAFKDDPPEFFMMENVPRIATRGNELLEEIEALLTSYGYAVARTTHDCGEIAGLAQSRKRFLLVARHIEKVPPFLYEPQTRPLKSVGEVLGAFPMPGCPTAGAMHELPMLQWKTWVRLAFVEAGKDWRSISHLDVDNDGNLSDYLIVPEYFSDYLGVRKWNEHTGAVAGRSTVSNGAYAVADPRYDGKAYSQYGVVKWEGKAHTVTGQRSPGQGPFSVADPRPSDDRWGGGKYKIVPWSGSAGAVIGASSTGEGAFAVQDPRPALNRQKGDHYLTGGHYGVVNWKDHAGAVTSAGKHDNGRFSVADPRTNEVFGDCTSLPNGNDRMQCVIRSTDGAWHRPFTTLELGALQGYIEPGEYMEMHGGGHTSWREQIGNMVPPPAATAIFNVIAETILLAKTGETFTLGSTPIWVKDLAIATSIKQPNDTMWR